MKLNENMLRLYAVTDRNWLRGETIVDQVDAVKEHDLIRAGFDAFLDEAIEMKALCERCNVPLIINDNVEIALRSGADGVHVGQDDMRAEDIRKMAGRNLIVGVTAKTVEQALDAQAAGADYLGSGAVFGSTTKTNARPMTRETLSAICAAVDIPVVAIGGINRNNISELLGTGISGVAVVSGIFAAEDIEEECRLLLDLAREVSGR